MDVVKKRLQRQNPALKTEGWLVMSRKVGEKGQTVAFSIEQVSFKALGKNHFKAFWGLRRVDFRILKAEKT